MLAVGTLPSTCPNQCSAIGLRLQTFGPQRLLRIPGLYYTAHAVVLAADEIRSHVQGLLVAGDLCGVEERSRRTTFRFAIGAQLSVPDSNSLV